MGVATWCFYHRGIKPQLHLPRRSPLGEYEAENALRQLFRPGYVQPKLQLFTHQVAEDDIPILCNLDVEGAKLPPHMAFGLFVPQVEKGLFVPKQPAPGRHMPDKGGVASLALYLQAAELELLGTPGDRGRQRLRHPLPAGGSLEVAAGGGQILNRLKPCLIASSVAFGPVLDAQAEPDRFPGSSFQIAEKPQHDSRGIPTSNFSWHFEKQALTDAKPPCKLCAED